MYLISLLCDSGNSCFFGMLLMWCFEWLMCCRNGVMLCGELIW